MSTILSLGWGSERDGLITSAGFGNELQSVGNEEVEHVAGSVGLLLRLQLVITQGGIVRYIWSTCEKKEGTKLIQG